jgi:hypothetical protein
VFPRSVRQYSDAPGGGPTVGEDDPEAVGDADVDALADDVVLCFGAEVIPLFAVSASCCEA